MKIESVPEAAVASLEGQLDASGKRFAIVVARFNAFITERLLLSACDGLLRTGAAKKDIAVVRVPGAFEIPSAARTLAEGTGFHRRSVVLQNARERRRTEASERFVTTGKDSLT